MEQSAQTCADEFKPKLVKLSTHVNELWAISRIFELEQGFKQFTGVWRSNIKCCFFSQ